MWKKINDERIRFCLKTYIEYCHISSEQKRFFEYLPQEIICAINQNKNEKVKIKNMGEISVNFLPDITKKSYDSFSLMLKVNGKYIKYKISYANFNKEIYSGSAFNKKLLTVEQGTVGIFKEKRVSSLSIFLEKLGKDALLNFINNAIPFKANEHAICVKNLLSAEKIQLTKTKEEYEKYDRHMFNKNNKIAEMER